MFAKLAVYTTALFSVLAVATPVHHKRDGGCSTGPVQCCNSVESASSPAAADAFAVVGVVLQDVTAEVGLTCSPIDVLGGGLGSSCSGQAVCCQDNSYGGLVSVGCVPVQL